VHVVLDARTAGPLEVVPPDPAAVAGAHSLKVERRLGDDTASVTEVRPHGFPAGTRVGHAGPSLPAGELEVSVAAEFTGPSAAYWLGWTERGRVPDGFVRRPRTSELAKVRTTIATKNQGGARTLMADMLTPSGAVGATFKADMASSPTSTRYTTTDVAWRAMFIDSGSMMFGGQERFRAGRTYERSFGAPVVGPAMYTDGYPNLTRTGDEVVVALSLFGDRDGNQGYPTTTSARTALYRGGELVGENGNLGYVVFTVPPGPGVLRARTEVTRSTAVSDFSTRISVDWTFRSDTTPGLRRLPMSVVRFTPVLDPIGNAPANRPLSVPLIADQQAGVDNRPLHRFRVEVSYDDGARWTGVPVMGRSALVGNRAAAGTFVSLRVHAVDDRGGELSQTVIRAYRLG
jgi:hypothetical protein